FPELCLGLGDAAVLCIAAHGIAFFLGYLVIGVAFVFLGICHCSTAFPTGLGIRLGTGFRRLGFLHADILVVAGFCAAFRLRHVIIRFGCGYLCVLAGFRVVFMLGLRV